MQAGTGLVADPGAIRRYGAAVAGQEGPLARINAALAGAHLPGNAFGLLPEAGELHAAYTQHADEVRQITAKLPGQIGEVASGLDRTASAYTTIESDLADGIRSIYGLPGAGGGGSTAAGTGAAVFANIVSSTVNAYKWVQKPEVMLPALVASLDGAKGGLAGLLDAAINWVIDHVPELPKLLNDVTGDTGALLAAAATWHDQAVALNAVLRGLKAPAACFPEAWAGNASAAFGHFMADVTTSLTVMAGAMGQTQEILQDAAKESAFAHDTIVMIIREVVEWVAGNILVDALTLGLATAAEAAGTAAWLDVQVARAEEAASRLASVYRALKGIVDKLQELKDGVETAKGLERLKKFMSLGKDFGHVLEAGKLRNFRVFGNGRLARAADVIWDVGKHGGNAKELKEAIEVGKAGVAARVGVKVAMSGTAAATGLPGASGAKGLAQDLGMGALGNMAGNGQGFAETVHLESPPVNRIAELLNAPPPVEQGK